MALGSLSACGFALRGTTADSKVAHGSVTLTTSDQALTNALKKELALTGFVVADSQNHITISNTNLARYELVGVLTEIRLILTANVRYQIGENAHIHTLTATRSYQYNEAGVSTQDNEAAQVQAWLYDDLARQVSEQFYTLSQSPAPQTP